MAYIQFKNVNKIYSSGEVEVKALDNVNFEITSIEGEESIKYEIDRNGNIMTYVE